MMQNGNFITLIVLFFSEVKLNNVFVCPFVAQRLKKRKNNKLKRQEWRGQKLHLMRYNLDWTISCT